MLVEKMNVMWGGLRTGRVQFLVGKGKRLVCFVKTGDQCFLNGSHIRPQFGYRLTPVFNGFHEIGEANLY